MTIILDRIATPERGLLEIRMSVEIEISAQEARKQVDRWLLARVSSSFGTEPPVLVIGEQTVWRVPVVVGFSQRGSFELGVVTVNAVTGEMNTSLRLAQQLQQAAGNIIEQFPAFQPRQAAKEFVARFA